jgi:hypothetical protein
MLTEQEIVESLDSQFLPLEPDVTGLRLRRPGLSSDAATRVSLELGVSLSSSFLRLAREYDLGDFTLGPIAFGHGASYEVQLRNLNTKGEPQWWGEGNRPAHLAMFANSDPRAFLLDTQTGSILALHHGLRVVEAVLVATDFALFLRGAATILLARLESGIDERGATLIAHEVGASGEGRPFWSELAA